MHSWFENRAIVAKVLASVNRIWYRCSGTLLCSQTRLFPTAGRQGEQNCTLFLIYIILILKFLSCSLHTCISHLDEIYHHFMFIMNSSMHLLIYFTVRLSSFFYFYFHKIELFLTYCTCALLKNFRLFILFSEYQVLFFNV